MFEVELKLYFLVTIFEITATCPLLECDVCKEKWQMAKNQWYLYLGLSFPARENAGIFAQTRL